MHEKSAPCPGMLCTIFGAVVSPADWTATWTASSCRWRKRRIGCNWLLPSLKHLDLSSANIQGRNRRQKRKRIMYKSFRITNDNVEPQMENEETLRKEFLRLRRVRSIGAQKLRGVWGESNSTWITQLAKLWVISNLRILIKTSWQYLLMTCSLLKKIRLVINQVTVGAYVR